MCWTWKKYLDGILFRIFRFVEPLINSCNIMLYFFKNNILKDLHNWYYFLICKTYIFPFFYNRVFSFYFGYKLCDNVILFSTISIFLHILNNIYLTHILFKRNSLTSPNSLAIVMYALGNYWKNCHHR